VFACLHQLTQVVDMHVPANDLKPACLRNVLWFVLTRRNEAVSIRATLTCVEANAGKRWRLTCKAGQRQ